MWTGSIPALGRSSNEPFMPTDVTGCERIFVPSATGPTLSRSLLCSGPILGDVRFAGPPSGNTLQLAADDTPPTAIGVYDNENGHSAPGYGFDYPTDLAVGADGHSYVTGTSWSGPAEMNLALTTVAFDEEGGTLWAAREEGSLGRVDAGAAVVVSPDGRQVFVTGTRDFRITGGDYAANIETVAYEASSGKRLWSATYDGPMLGDRMDVATGIAVSPGGEHVYVTGQSQSTKVEGSYYESRFVTIAYDASDGRELWSAPLAASGANFRPADIEVDPLGRFVYVVGKTGGPITIVAYRTGLSNGSQGGSVAWVVQDASSSAVDNIQGPRLDLAVAPGGDAVYVMSALLRNDFPVGFVTSSYEAVSGTKRFSAVYEAQPPQTYALPAAMTISPDGARLFVVGQVTESDPTVGLIATNSLDTYALTVAYDTKDGSRAWVGRFEGPQSISPTGITASPDGSQVVVTGWGGEVAGGEVPVTQLWGWDLQPAYVRWGGGLQATTFAQAAGSGDQLWVAPLPAADLPVGSGAVESQAWIGLGVETNPKGGVYVLGAFSKTSAADGAIWVTDDRLGAANLPLLGNTMDYGVFIYE